MRLKVTTWNINSVRLRLPLVLRFLDEHAPDVLCLQETKCPDDKFPSSDLRKAGYEHIEFVGQKGYHGVAVLSRLPLETRRVMSFCGKADARHMAVRLAPGAGAAAGITIHNFYVPAGGDVPDPALNEKFAHKLQFLAEMRAWGAAERPTAAPAILVGDLNVAPLEHDVWSHKQLLGVVSHTPVETQALETLRGEAGWADAARVLVPEPEKIYTWWSYRAPDWAKANKGRRLDHVWLSQDLMATCRSVDVLTDARGWDRPSDHAPVTATLVL
ncbi:exodeoxyribonuclease III [Salinarimonas sp. NSM]|uniref:exodeoxyribonuclease III n=1 Tax=Salinarimonas sp. NSM TaxID=3458003 RepID=UPI00403717FA